MGRRTKTADLTPAGRIGRNNRRRGSVGERELARKLADLTGLAWRRGLLQSRFGGRETADVVCEDLPEIHIEAKRAKARVNYIAAMRQAADDAAAKGQLPVVMGREDEAEWMVFLRLADLIGLVELLAERMAAPRERKKKIPPPPPAT